MPTLHPIQVAARLTGLSTHVIRIWEHRYQAVSPERTASNRRMYSEPDIERLLALRDATRCGHGIGNIARLPTTELRELVRKSSLPAAPAANGEAAILAECLAAMRRLDRAALEGQLEQAALAMGFQGALLRVLAPMAQALGDLWQAGQITAAHEHFASSVLRDFVARQHRPLPGGGDMPRLLTACPAGQIHEMGAIFVAALAANLGWAVTQLGTGLPALEIAGAARLAHVRAVALSLVYPPGDPQVAEEIRTLAKHLPGNTALLVGGRAAPSYLPAIRDAGGVLLHDLADLASTLDSLRASPGP
ncbi:MAG: MerR family transcriptional regulator [Akkermansiaceae bacterium]|jgi:DNA-binding transcriptional MerR regulator/methylmalonyl-CoA mutase cobalamin-binding subunit|nr:MerR family transcriptional regulator [Akkermansiaceae bacterium]